MPRIRTIKPEFPHSQTMGRCSRDARLAFVNIWTQVDDAGRLNGNSRFLASLLFPYDTDALDLIDSWLSELERENCIRRYNSGGNTYLEVCNWLQHQKIDRPTPSRLPQFDEGSRLTREDSMLDHGPRTMDLGPRIMDQKYSSELASQSSKPDATAMPIDAIDQGKPDEETTETVALLWFPCAGKKDSWALQQPMVEELSQAFPAVDVLAECKKALAWVNANQKKKKTYSGMPKFITGWMSRVQDRGGTRGGPAMPSPNGPMPLNPFGSRLEGVEERISARMKGGP